MTQIDEKAFKIAMDKAAVPVAELLAKLIAAYEAARARHETRTISSNDLETFEKYLDLFGAKSALAILGITVEG